MNASHNRIDFKTSSSIFKDKRLSFSVSTRKIHPNIDMVDYLRVFYMYCNWEQIESVYGNTNEFSKLYGGRLPQYHYDLTPIHIASLEQAGIGLALTLTNHFFDDEAYNESRILLEHHHKKGNSIVCTNDELAKRLRKDYPLYQLKASIIKKLDGVEKVKRALDIYDSVTLPMDKNDDDEFLMSLEEKHRIILFGNANCAYTCPARTCYIGFSQEIRGEKVTSICSKDNHPRLDMGFVYFNVQKLGDMGFTHFKLLALTENNPTLACRQLSRKKGFPIEFIKQYKRAFYLCSYKKCGRTWLRFILANYFNLLFNLNIKIDLHSYFSLMPNDDHDPFKGVDFYGFPNDSRFPIVLSRHSHYSEEKFRGIGNRNMILILRSIKDVVVSDFFQASRVLKSFDRDLKSFIRDSEGGLSAYCGYLNSWAEVIDGNGPLVITYEMLHRDTEETVGKIISFLGVELDGAKLKEGVNLSSFESMQKLEKQMGMPGHSIEMEDEEGLRMRKGKVGGSLDYLDDVDLRFIERACESLLTESAKGMLKKYGLSYNADSNGIKQDSI